MKTEYKDISSYHRAQQKEDRAICDLLKSVIERALPLAESKLWHGSPVWFLDGNPVVGYQKLKEEVRLLFWSGQSFDDPGLTPDGSFKAAEVRYTSISQVKVTHVRRRLSSAKKVQWDYKNIVKNRGKLKKAVWLR